MTKKIITVLLLSTCVTSTSRSQEQAPTLKGKAVISIKNGTIDCDFKLVDIPKIPDYVFIINSGMNIRYIRNIEDDYSFGYERVHNDTISDEGLCYYIPANKKGKLVREALQFSYTGKYPVYKDTLRSTNYMDWRGNIAFNDHSLRTDGAQAAWYPVLYDIRKKKRYENIRYDIEITCSDCNTIYLNGNAPVKGKKGHFKSDVPMELFLFAGNFKTEKVSNTWFINPDITTAQMSEFGKMTERYKKYYEDKLHIPYKHNIAYLRATPVSKRNSWMFVAYPTIIVAGRGNNGMKGFFDKKEGDDYKPFIAHELGHYYFGEYLHFNSELGGALSEAFAEYMAFKITKEYLPDSFYNDLIAKKISEVKDFHPMPLSKIKSEHDYGNRELICYYSTPLLLLAIEKEIGPDKMWQWLHTILVTKTDFTNYDFLKTTLKTSLNDDNTYRAISDKYFESDVALKTAIDVVTKK